MPPSIKPSPHSVPVVPGLDVFLEAPPRILRRARLGLLTNQAAVDRSFRPAPEAVAQALPGRLTALFSPQHGLWGEQQDNMIETPHTRHPRLGLPVYSLYAETRRPSPEMLENIDALLVDLQDVGCRVYTFAWTVLGCLEVCAQLGIAVIILDRPNPLGGTIIEGPVLDMDYASFVGRAPIPLHHDLTLGELAIFLKNYFNFDLELDIVPLRGWRRSMQFADTGLPWLPPSPNLPRLEAVAVYPGQVLFEGVNLSEGRGLTTPFEVCGAPFIDPYAWRDQALGWSLPGVVLRPIRFLPMFGKFAGESCGGLCLHVTDSRTFRPVRTALALLAAARRLWPEHFQWRPPPYEYETVKMPIDILTGGTAVRRALEQVETFSRETLQELCRIDSRGWADLTDGCRRYPD